MARVGRCAAFAGLLLFTAACGGGGSGGTTPSVLPTPAETPTGFAYLQDVTGTGAAVCHQSAQPDAYRAQWSLAAQPGAPLGEVAETEAALQHVLRLGPLAPDTAYRYRLRTSAGTLLAEGTFTTAPPPQSRAVTFAAISDSGWPGGAEAQVAQAIAASSPAPELLLHAGDVVYPHGGREGYGPWLFEPFARVIDHAPIFPAVGNHDLETQQGAPWLAAFTTPANNAARDERHYSFDWGDLHVLVLDVASGVCRAGGSQWGFASEDLSLARGAWKIVVLHYPPYSMGPSGGNADVVRHLVPLFEARRVDVVLSGHDHTYQRFKPKGGVLYLVTGGGGAPPDPLKESSELAFARSTNHFLRGRADASTLLLQALDLQGGVFDQVELRR
jgi:predicted phosphodiesterase